VVNRLEDVTVPTVAAVEGACVGGGLALAAACDPRVATASSVFGADRPDAGQLPVDEHVLTSVAPPHSWCTTSAPAARWTCCCAPRLLSAADAHAAGFVGEVVSDGALNPALDSLIQTLPGHAPLSMKAAGQALARLRRAGLPAGDDLVREVVGSADFRAGVRAFVDRGQVSWTGR
jgi:enoyl-CoA hydratase/carnithine racemase